MFTIRFDNPTSLDTRLVGGKALGLASMTQAGLPVSPGFTVSTKAYHQYLDALDLRGRIVGLLGSVDRSSVDALSRAERAIGTWFEEGEFPLNVHQEVSEAYTRLCREVGIDDMSVAIRSSATAEDAVGASFAGEYDTFVGMRGAGEVERYVRRCWASAFTARSMAYAWKNGISPTDVEMAVVVQKTVEARAAGVMFTLSPLTGDRSRIVIEAAYGLGLSVVGGEVTPDRYVVAKVGGEIIERIVGDKQVEYLTGSRATPVDEVRRKSLCLEDHEVKELARLGKALERRYQHPVDVEFAVDRQLSPDSCIVLLQCRPETYWSSRHAAATTAPIQGAAQAVLATVLKGHRQQNGLA
jgi:pyruvate,water dikinase